MDNTNTISDAALQLTDLHERYEKLDPTRSRHAIIAASALSGIGVDPRLNNFGVEIAPDITRALFRSWIEGKIAEIVQSPDFSWLSGDELIVVHGSYLTRYTRRVQRVDAGKLALALLDPNYSDPAWAVIGAVELK